jgi:hypothetical protein
MAMGSFLSEDDWRDLLREIHNRQVIPVVGPELVTVPDPNGTGQLPLYRALAPQLASRLRLPLRDAPLISLNRVACEYLLSGGSRKSMYKEYAGIATGEDVLVQMPDEMPRGSVFISYSKDDKEAVGTLVRGLRAAQIPVWVDKQRLHAGENYQRNLEFAVKSGCSFFVSVISRATESDATRFVHNERRWAAQRHVDGFIYYIPVIIDDTKEPTLEPASFAKIHFDRLPEGSVTASFTNKLRKWVEDHRVAGQPRD